MSLVSILFTLALIGLITWLFCQIPMPIQIRNIIVAVAVIFLVLWVLQHFGVHTGLPSLRLR